MPLGFTRINPRTQQPNPLINFIRPIGRTKPKRSQSSHAVSQLHPDEEAAIAYLSRIAAIVYPIMRKHHIAVMALEEFPPNPEFAGRNFNAGEVIQLVIRRRGHGRGPGSREGGWLPERWVQMVMIHELAHCKQMNHSRAFWKVRDEYAAELKELWAKSYTGEGLWGVGRSLESGELVVGGTSVAEDEQPEHLCGGVYKSRGRKRRRKTKSEASNLTYQEKKERRILKKFGPGGAALGTDEQERVKLEGGGSGKVVKPRVASSNRGRELRAAAALARFEQSKPKAKEEEEAKAKVKEEGDKEIIVLDDDSISDSDSDVEYVSDGDAAIDLDGKKLLDMKGHGLVKVCEDEKGTESAEARKEIQELYDIRNFMTASKVEKAKGKHVMTSSGSSSASATGTMRTSREPTQNPKQTKLTWGNDPPPDEP